MRKKLPSNLSLLLPINAWAQHLLSDEEAAEYEARRMIRESDLGIERVEFFSEDGVWSYTYTLPEDLETPALWVEGTNTWRYDGQAVYRSRLTQRSVAVSLTLGGMMGRPCIGSPRNLPFKLGGPKFPIMF